ncbi:MAG: cobalamin-dependent protein, partial [Thermoplasmatota archaeon]
LPVIREGRTEYRVGPDEFASHMESYWEYGVNIIGGCCGTKREHIEKLRTLLSGRPPVEREIAPRFAVTCPGRIVDFDGFVVIGERINPAGRKRMKAVMASGDIKPILIEAREQVKAGASILDVNFGDERSVPIEFMERVVLEITYGLNIPLSLDVQTVDILERLTRSYPGRPLVNSSTSRQEELVEKAGIIGRYGGILITLAMGRHVPRDFEERKANIESALKIMDGIGIDRQRILFDPIVLSMGAGADPVHTLRTIDHLNRMGLFSVYGLSNLSFGMPKRSFLNSAFLVLSVEKGLRSAIMDPLDENLMGSLDSSLMIFGRKELPSSELADVEATTRLILDGRSDELLAMIKDRAAQSGINKVVNEDLKPAMEDVGELYAKGRIYLPQLIRAAETVKPSFEYIDTLIDPHEEKETFMIATVKGDIHDIGKNIVAAIIRGSGYRVIDLGKDVPADVIVQETVRNGPIALGLSAMMTTTAPRIKEVVDLLRKNGCKVMVIAGGASLNEDAARSLGADHYSRDAVGAISILKRISSGLPDTD